MKSYLFNYYMRQRDSIFSMATPWKEIKNDLKSHIFRMIEHLVKLYYYHDFYEYHRGWIDSVRKGFSDVPKIKGQNKLPSKEQMLDFLWNERLSGDPDGLHQTVIDDIINKHYNDVPLIEPDEIRYEGFRDFLKSYLEILSESISKTGSIEIGKIHDFVNEYDYGFSLKEK